MGRKKLEIKKIQDLSNRQVAFAKRRGGFLKKAEQLSILCDAQIAAMVFSARGKFYQFPNGNRLDAILQRYHDVSGADGINGGDGRKAPKIHKSKKSECASSQPNEMYSQRAPRYLDEVNLDQLTMDDLTQLQIEMEIALGQTRAKMVSINGTSTLKKSARRLKSQTGEMMEQITALQEKEKLLREENELLQQQIAAKGMENISGKENELLNLADNESNHSAVQEMLMLLF